MVYGTHMFCSGRLMLSNIGRALAVLLVFSFAYCKKSTTDDKKIFTDDFNRANGHPGASYALNLPSGTTFSIVSNQLYAVYSGAAPAAMYTGKVTGNHKISAKFVISGGTYTGIGYIFGRSTSSDSGNNAYACGYNGGQLVLGRVASGTISVLATTSLHSLTAGVSDTFTFKFEGNTLTCSLTGGSTISVSLHEPTYGDGYVGLMGGGSAGNYLYIDDLLIEKL